MTELKKVEDGLEKLFSLDLSTKLESLADTFIEADEETHKVRLNR